VVSGVVWPMASASVDKVGASTKVRREKRAYLLCEVADTGWWLICVGS